MTGLREKRKQATREAILQAAHDLILAQGFGATTMAEVARAAQVSVGSFYNYFANKDALLIGIMAEASGDVLSQGQRVLDEPGDDAQAAVFRLLHIYLESLELFEKPLLKEALAVAFTATPEVLTELAGLDMMLAEQLGELVAGFQARGLITDEVPVMQASMALYGTLIMALMLWMSLPDTDHDQLHAGLDQQLTVIFRGLHPHPP